MALHPLTAPMRPTPGVIREFVFAPIEELGATPIFAFGVPWFSMLEDHLRLPVIARLSDGGHPYPTHVRDRAAFVFSLPSGAAVIAVKQAATLARRLCRRLCCFRKRWRP